MIPSGFFDMKTTVKACGLTASIIRMWEARYGWPSPRRLSNGYRVYSEALVEDLKVTAALVKGGTPISKLVDKQGNINLPRAAKPSKRPLLTLASKVPEPSSREGKEVRQAIIDGFMNQDPGKVLEAIALVPTLHPRERAPACFAPACAALVDLEVEKKGILKRDTIVAALSLVMGGTSVLEETMQAFLQFVVIKQEAQA